jgi:hypothetical protein
MLPDTIITALTQFGAAGLIALIWLVERRHSGARERQLDEAHSRLVSQQRDLEAMLTVVKENTRAIEALEAAQRRLVELIEHVARPARSRAV